MAQCPQCGWQHDGTARFCQQCGTPLTPAAAAAPGAPPAGPYGPSAPPGGPYAPGAPAGDPYAPSAPPASPYGPNAPTVPIPAYGAPPAAPEPQWTSAEQDLWQGKSFDLLTGGSLSPNHYRVTTRALYFSHGRIGSSENTVPLWAVTGITVEEHLAQKTRGVGTLIVRLEHSDWTDELKAVRLEDVDAPHQVRDLILQQAREEFYNYERRKQTLFYQGRPPLPPR